MLLVVVTPISLTKLDYKSLHKSIGDEDPIRHLDELKIAIDNMAGQIIALEHIIRPKVGSAALLLAEADLSLCLLSFAVAVTIPPSDLCVFARVRLNTVVMPMYGRTERVIVSGTLKEWKTEIITYCLEPDDEYVGQRQFYSEIYRLFKLMKIDVIFKNFDVKSDSLGLALFSRKK